MENLDTIEEAIEENMKVTSTPKLSTISRTWLIRNCNSR